MKTKKSHRANLEPKRGLFLKVGFIIALSIVYTAFQIKSYDIDIVSLIDRNAVNNDMEFIEIVPVRQELPPPPPRAEPLLLKIVDNEVEIDEEVIVDAEPDPFNPVEIWTPPQIDEEEIDDDIRFVPVEIEPSFPGGESARLAYLRNNIKYPHIARETGIQGIVYVGFVVEKDGSISNIKLLRGIGGGCDEEAIRIISMMPKWNPGLQAGKKAVRVQYNMPIKFVLVE